MVQAYVRNLGTCRFDDKGRVKWKPHKTRIPKQSTGAEHSVVVKKSL